jgi:hypothetical protein
MSARIAVSDDSQLLSSSGRIVPLDSHSGDHIPTRYLHIHASGRRIKL